MFTYEYEIQKDHHSELRSRADNWRLVREAKQGAKAARAAERRARRTRRSRGAAHRDTEGTSAASPSPLGRVRRALHPRSAA